MQTSNEGKNIILSFILLNFNNVDYTIPCIYSIQKSLTVPHEIIVVDNASSDESVEKLSQIEGIKLVTNTINRGFTGGNNDGVRIAEGKYLVILNNDTIVDDPGMNKLPAILDSHSKYDVVGGRLIGIDGKEQPSGGYEPYLLFFLLQFTVLCYKYVRFSWLKQFYISNWNNDNVQEVDWASGCFFAMRRDSYCELGGFDENIFIYLDEVDLHKRIREKGGKIYLYPHIVIRHYGQISWGGTNHHVGLKHNYDSVLYYVGKYCGFLPRLTFVFIVKTVNLIYLPALILLRLFTLGRNGKINNKLRFCRTLLLA